MVTKVLIQTRRAGEDTTAQGTLEDTLLVTPKVLLQLVGREKELITG